MEELTTKVGIPGLSGLAGIVLGWFGLRARIKSAEVRTRDIEANITSLKGEVRFEVTCDKVHEALDTRLATIEGLHKETRDDIKEILRRTPRND